MRPDNFVPYPRKQSTGADGAGSSSLTEPGFTAPETFFLARDGKVESSQAAPQSLPSGSTYGVQSLDETTDNIDASEVAVQLEEAISHSNTDTDDRNPPSLRRMDTVRPYDTHDSDHEQRDLSRSAHLRNPSPSSTTPFSLPLTPLTLGSPAEPSSMPSSPKSTSTRSFRPHDISDDDGAHPGIVPRAEDNNKSGFSSQFQDSTPQLIMPSIQMPSRRPFTEKGKTIGRLKILIAGAKGSGKTSLLKSIVQTSEDIVHVDPPPPNATEPQFSRSTKTRSKQAPLSEIYASTKPYPPWWSDLEDSRVLRRRRSLEDVVLERNICFVDIHGGTTKRTSQTDCAIQYLRAQLQRALAAAHSKNRDFQGLLSGNGGSQVDVILYLISEDTLPADIEHIRRLSDFSNVIPLVSKSDLLSPQQLASLKQGFLEKSEEKGVRLFWFGDSPCEPGDGANITPPLAVSSAKSSDDENMDASILMSPDYVPPLVPSELGLLVEKLFDVDNLAWMRHSAAKKLVQSLDLPTTTSRQPHAPPTPNSQHRQHNSSFFASPTSSVSPSQVLVSYPGSDGPPSYALARVADHTRREERLAQVRLAKWAADLQRSLQNERERYEALARGERAVWLTERLGECVADGTLLPVTQTPGFSNLQVPSKEGGSLTVRGADGRHLQYRVVNMSPHDPLGLIRWNEDLKRRGWMVVQVVGSVGIVGGLAVWVARVCGFNSQSLPEWPASWFGGE